MVEKTRRLTRDDWLRIGFVTLLAFVAGAALHLRMEFQIFGVPVPLLTGTLYAVMVAPITIAVFVFLPSLKDMVECLAFSRLAVSAFVLAFPAAGTQILANPFLLASLVVVGGGILKQIRVYTYQNARSSGPSPAIKISSAPTPFT